MAPINKFVKEDDARLLGFQALVFEMNWPSFKWIRSVFADFNLHVVTLWIECSESPPASSVEACSAMFKEIFVAVYRDRGWELMLVYQNVRPNSANFQVVMSDEIFKRLAAEVAPWRLRDGR